MTCRADLEDIKMRFPNSPSGLFWGEALGANPIPMSYSDVYLGLQTGAVNGQDNAVGKIRSESFYEVTESVTITGHVVSGNPVFISEELYQSMSSRIATDY